jgi:aryl-alcohol dehydrogenase-like predicted oxidoreductase
MEYATLGGTGTTVSRLCLGCYGFGSGSEWMLDPPESTEIVERAIDHGINFFDTANRYSRGESEVILGDALAGYDRDAQVIATKLGMPMSEDPNSGGLSRKTVEQQIRGSLERLGVETIDLYQAHRWDDDTPVEETVRALDDCVRRGQARSLGASSMWAHQFQAALHASDSLGLERFATMQNHYSLVYREEEREMLPLCEREDVGVFPWGPLAHGFLARPHEEFDTTARAETGWGARNRIEAFRSGGGVEINERVRELATEKGVSMAQVSLAWLLARDVDAVTIGPSSVEHLDDAVAALDLDLSAAEQEYLEAPYEPIDVVGHE